jgi:uncharacterized integral membrane protein
VFTLILFLVAIGIVALFSVQNAIPVTITFLFWKFEASLVIVIFLAVLLGVLIGAIARSFMKYKSDKKTIHDIDKKQAG